MRDSTSRGNRDEKINVVELKHIEAINFSNWYVLNLGLRSFRFEEEHCRAAGHAVYQVSTCSIVLPHLVALASLCNYV